ncbi:MULTISPECIES: DUF4175 domain-containing protein [unclassified Paracoccus (in: a-proteobacteria)]|uniref:DUF4175 domain-containing protein n=1 Tax=unclassified Paracoccus (in: a-proteobacteria) TaxID=2688777 RepID=UPI0021E18B78|nr:MULTISPECIES: DUF4175 domain-containing protein [unclassified Paracoccus (in: a-proteobacteria)]UXU75058.1 DUF4175 domain-containing protein [Paracoccus sp. SMMA_5]UXU80961.1 DUF4175 domain-containing protein [Paracoccus sp. SMMA_5_TC]
MKAQDSPRIRLAIALTRAGMWWEELARNFWLPSALLALAGAALAFGAADMVPTGALRAMTAVLALAVLALVWRGLRRLRRPTTPAARARVDASLPERPLSALADSIAIGAEDAGAARLWQAHQARMWRLAQAARPVAPDAGLRWRDPTALRLAGLTALAMALIFAPAGRFGQGLAALGGSLRPVAPGALLAPDAPGWEGWAEPPAYTRRPTIYLNALPADQALELPKGTRLSFRLYGSDATLDQQIGPALPDSPPEAPAFVAEQSGAVTVAGRRFEVIVLPDAPPQVQAGAVPQRRVDGKLVQDFTASDDNGIVAGQAVIALDLGSIDRRFGLAVAPEPRDPVTLELPLPAMGSRDAMRGRLVADLARHPWANLPVTLSLSVQDGIGQHGRAEPLRMVLPGRRFFDPLAAALIELRRDLLWSRDNAAVTAQMLRAISWQPEGLMDPDLAAGLRGAVATLESGPLQDQTRNALAQVLWDAAVALEDGGLADALARMQQAQQRLSEAIRNGASPDEIQRLMQELKQATDAYVDMLARQQEQDPSGRFDRSPRQGQQITGDQIQQMMDEIQRLMNEGRMAEAQELLEQFNRMMQNLQVTRSPDGQGGSQRPMGRLAQTLRDQQQLADEAMRQLQDQYGQWQPQPPEDASPGDPGQAQGQDQQAGPQGQGGSGESLADRQRALREDLGRQRGLLPGRGTPQGEQARRQLDQAGRAMDEAERALRDGDPGAAMERQAQAIESLREGMRALGELEGQNQAQNSPQPGTGQDGAQGSVPDPRGQRGLARPQDRGSQTDPLGRSLAGEGNAITGGDPLAEGADPARKARELQDEIRRRAGEPQRPADERDYLDRLLDGF